MNQLLYKLESLFHRLVPNWLINPRYCYVYRMPCSYRPVAHKRPAKLTCRWATEPDRQLLLKASSLTAKRLELGDRAAVLFIDEQLVGTVWISTGTYHDWDTDLKIELQPNEAWLYGAWIDRNFRGQHLYSYLIAHVCESLQQQSIDSLLLAVDWSNSLSQKVHKALGAERIGSLYGLCIFGSRHFRLNR